MKKGDIRRRKNRKGQPGNREMGLEQRYVQDTGLTKVEFDVWVLLSLQKNTRKKDIQTVDVSLILARSSYSLSNLRYWTKCPISCPLPRTDGTRFVLPPPLFFLPSARHPLLVCPLLPFSFLRQKKEGKEGREDLKGQTKRGREGGTFVCSGGG